jgi:hypothetical protein
MCDPEMSDAWLIIYGNVSEPSWEITRFVHNASRLQAGAVTNGVWGVNLSDSPNPKFDSGTGVMAQHLAAATVEAYRHLAPATLGQSCRHKKRKV